MILSGADVVLIGGVSGSGKSAFAQRLRLANPDVSTLAMDTVLGALDEARLPLRGRTHLGHADSVAAMERLGPALCSVVLQSGVRTIVEGGWIEPPAWEALVQAHDRSAAALFFGYPTATPDAILARLAGTTHWLAAAPDRAFVQAQIDHSRRLRHALIDSRHAAFVDVSDGFRSDAEVAEVLRPLLSRRAG